MAGKTPEIIEVDVEHLDEFMLRAKDSLANEDYELLDRIVQSYSGIVGTIQDNSISLRRLRKMLFGSCSEKTTAVTGEAADRDETRPTADSSDENTPADGEPPKKKLKGHGRNGADAYEGAERIVVPHETLSHGDLCPDCLKGHVYKVALPGVLVRIVGQAPLHAKVYELCPFGEPA
jgi:transposase